VQILPLPQRLGDALAQYLRHGRPSTASRAVFIRLRAPRNRPVTADTVRKVMCRAAHRCGLGASWKGTHRLRQYVSRPTRSGKAKAPSDFLGILALSRVTSLSITRHSFRVSQVR
jgi:integrase